MDPILILTLACFFLCTVLYIQSATSAQEFIAGPSKQYPAAVVATSVVSCSTGMAQLWLLSSKTAKYGLKGVAIILAAVLARVLLLFLLRKGILAVANANGAIDIARTRYSKSALYGFGAFSVVLCCGHAALLLSIASQIFRHYYSISQPLTVLLIAILAIAPLIRSGMRCDVAFSCLQFSMVLVGFLSITVISMPTHLDRASAVINDFALPASDWSIFLLAALPLADPVLIQRFLLARNERGMKQVISRGFMWEILISTFVIAATLHTIGSSDDNLTLISIIDKMGEFLPDGLKALPICILMAAIYSAVIGNFLCSAITASRFVASINRNDLFKLRACAAIACALSVVAALMPHLSWLDHVIGAWVCTFAAPLTIDLILSPQRSKQYAHLSSLAGLIAYCIAAYCNSDAKTYGLAASSLVAMLMREQASAQTSSQPNYLSQFSERYIAWLSPRLTRAIFALALYQVGFLLSSDLSWLKTQYTTILYILSSALIASFVFADALIKSAKMWFVLYWHACLLLILPLFALHSFHLVGGYAMCLQLIFAFCLLFSLVDKRWFFGIATTSFGLFAMFDLKTHGVVTSFVNGLSSLSLWYACMGWAALCFILSAHSPKRVKIVPEVRFDPKNSDVHQATADGISHERRMNALAEEVSAGLDLNNLQVDFGEFRRALNVLIVDRDLASVNLLGMFFLEMKCNVQRTQSGKVALDLLGESPVDIVITSALTTDISGLELLRCAHINPLTKPRKCLLARDGTENRGLISAFQKFSIAGFLFKPYARAEVRFVVASVCNDL